MRPIARKRFDVIFSSTIFMLTDITSSINIELDKHRTTKSEFERYRINGLRGIDMENVIEVKNLKREYIVKKGWVHPKKSQVMAVDGISFQVKRGEIFGLLGENGAGKTTTIKMLITLLAPTSGTCKVLGYDTFGEEKAIRPRINFIFGGEMGVYRRLSARDNLLYFAGLYCMGQKEAEQRADELLKLVDLQDDADHLVETFSKGMVQRLQIARGLLNDPEIIFMDEPTIGLDPVGARMLRGLIQKMKSQGKTVLLTTHYMYEADELCDQIAIMNSGKIMALDTSENLKEQYGANGKDTSLEDVFIAIIGKEKETQE